MKNLITIHTDGGARGNPGPAAIGVVIENNGALLYEFGKHIGETTNNVAEYLAVIEALHWIVTSLPKLQSATIVCYLDSLLVVNQLNGVYKMKSPHLRELLLKIKVLEQQVGGDIHYVAVRREQNKQADFLVNQALDNSLDR